MTLAVAKDGLNSARAVLRERCRALGMPMLLCDAHGAPVRAGKGAKDAGEGVAGALLRSQFMVSLLRRAAQGWAEQDEPEPTELFEGCWCIAMIESQRRKRVNYLVAFMLEPRCLEVEQFQAACQSASLDADAARTALAPIAIFEPGSVITTARMVKWAHNDRVELAIDEDTLCGFSRQLTEAYEEITLLQKLGRSMNELAQPERFVRLTCDELHATLSFRWIAARFVEDPRDARHMAGRCIISGERGCERSEFEALLDAAVSKIIPPAPLVMTPESTDDPRFAVMRSQLVAQPVMRAGRLIGALIAGEKHGPDPSILASDMKLLDAAAQHMTILLENAALYDDQQSMFLGTLEALTASIDAKDRYTCGHSERVAHLAMRLAAAVRMDEGAVERVRIAGLVHDVGKIGVPESVLCKPGRLTEEEFLLVKAHPEIGRRILADIPQLSDVLPAVLHHHERWDGTGYPQRLAGEDIPLYARLIALADSFDAMSSTRTYRAAMPREQVLAEIAKCGGTQFDPELAPRFVELDFSAYDAMVARHLERERRVSPQGRAA